MDKIEIDVLCRQLEVVANKLHSFDLNVMESAVRKAMDALNAAHNAQVAAAPDGWKLVPIKPTDEMERIGWRNQHPIGIYESMLSVAPSNPLITKE